MQNNRYFTAKILITILIFLFGSVSLDFFYRNQIMYNSRVAITERQLNQLNFVPQTLVLGDSHALNGIDPRYFDQGFNYSSQGETYMQTYYKFADYLREYPAPQAIILPLDLHSLSDFREQRINEQFYWRDRINWPDLLISYPKPELIKTMISASFFNYAGALDNFINWINQTPPAEIFLGHLPRENTINVDNANNQAARRTRRHFRGFNPQSELLSNYLLRTQQLAAQHDIRIIYTRFPVTHEYVQNASRFINPLGVLAAQEQLVRSHCREFNCNLEIVDANKLIDPTDYTLFHDSDHLSEQGAQLLSQKLKQELNL